MEFLLLFLYILHGHLKKPCLLNPNDFNPLYVYSMVPRYYIQARLLYYQLVNNTEIFVAAQRETK